MKQALSFMLILCCFGLPLVAQHSLSFTVEQDPILTADAGDQLGVRIGKTLLLGAIQSASGGSENLFFSLATRG